MRNFWKRVFHSFFSPFPLCPFSSRPRRLKTILETSSAGCVHAGAVNDIRLVAADANIQLLVGRRLRLAEVRREAPLPLLIRQSKGQIRRRVRGAPSVREIGGRQPARRRVVPIVPLQPRIDGHVTWFIAQDRIADRGSAAEESTRELEYGTVGPLHLVPAAGHALRA